MKKLINVRPAVVAAFGIGIGAALGYACYYYDIAYWWLIAAVPVTAALLIFFIVKGRTKYIVLTAVTAILFFVGFFGITYKLTDYGRTTIEDSSSCYITGVVAEKGYTDTGEYVKLKDVTSGGSSVDGKVYVYLDSNYGDYCEVGYTVSFYGTVYISSPFAYGTVSGTRLIEDIRYTAYPEGDVSSEYGFTLFGAVNIRIRQTLFNGMDKDVASVAYGMLTGNTDYVENGSLDSFRYGGVAHVFAVSGLHIGLVFAAITFLLKKLRVNQYVAAVLSVLAVFFYAGVCGFTLSSVRTAIMCTVMLAISLTGGKYDMLSSVSCAFIVIVLINPLNIISVGFQLSIAAVAGIALFSGVITRALARIKIKGRLASAIAVTSSAQIATFPILLSSFGYVSAAGLLMNVIFVPLLSAEFNLLFVCTVLSLIFQSISQALLLIPSAPLGAIMSLLVALGAEQPLISGFEFGVLVPLYYAVIFLLSDKINLKIHIRAAVAAVGVSVLAFALIVMNFVPSGRLKITASAYYGDSSAVLFQTSDSNVLVICSTPSSYDISILLRSNGVKTADAIIILGDDESIFAYTLCGETCEDIYVNYTNICIQPYTGTEVHYEKTFEIDGVTYTYADYGNLLVEYGGVTVGVNMYGDPPFGYCDLLITEGNSSECSCAKTVFFRQTAGYDNIYDSGDLQFTVKGGKLYS